MLDYMGHFSSGMDLNFIMPMLVNIQAHSVEDPY